LLVFISLTVFNVSAADTLYMMMHSDNEYYSGNQDALVVAQVIPSDNDNIKIKVIKVISKRDSHTLESEIYLDPLVLYFNLPEEKPKVGDYAVVPVKCVDDLQNFYVLSYNYMCRSDIGDYSDLRLYFDCNNPAAMDILAIENYVNSNAEIKNFAFDGDKNLLIVKDLGDNILQEIEIDNASSYLPKTSGQTGDDKSTPDNIVATFEPQPAPAEDPHEDHEEIDITDIIPEPDNRIDKIVPMPLIVVAALVFIASMTIYSINRKKTR